jgi:hypothetical protein
MSSRFVVLLLCTGLFGYVASAAPRPERFHISGTITQSGKALPGMSVTFDGRSSEIVKVDDAGFYEADLPVGVWSMTIVYSPMDAVTYRRPPFRVTAPTTLAFDISLPVAMLCSISIIEPIGHPVTADERARIEMRSCRGEEFFPVPSADGVPFEVHIWGLNNLGPCGRGKQSACGREYATYNLFSVQADKVAYDPRSGILEASGDVVIDKDSGDSHVGPTTLRRITFKIENGRVLPLQ